MGKVSYGVASIKAGGIDAVTGLPTALTSVGDVYKDTATMNETDGTETNHFAEMKTDPVITITEPGEETVEFSLMDTSADNLLAWIGGTVTTVGVDDTWNKPRDIENIEKSLEITTEDGTVITVNRAKIMAKREHEPTRKGVMLIVVKARILTPLIDGVPPVTVADPV